MSAAGGLSRRQLLGASGAAGTAALVAGCGVLPVKPTTLQRIARTVNHETDAPILERLLRLEYRMAYTYTASAPRLTGYGASLDRWFLRHELGHISAVSTLLKSSGIKPNTSAGEPRLGNARSSREVLSMLHSLEAEAIRAYAHAIATLSNGDLRAVMSAIMANEGQHIALVRRALGLEPVPSALLTGYE